jgi:hypothetical protein
MAADEFRDFQRTLLHPENSLLMHRAGAWNLARRDLAWWHGQVGQINVTGCAKLAHRFKQWPVLRHPWGDDFTRAMNLLRGFGRRNRFRRLNRRCVKCYLPPRRDKPAQPGR